MYSKRFNDPFVFFLIISILLLVTTLTGCISDPGKAKILEVKKGSPAQENGLKKGMIINYISYGDGDNFTIETVKRYDEVGDIISSLPPGELITIGVLYEKKDLVFENIELAENSDQKGYLGIETGPSSGLILSVNHIIVYFFVIITISILIYVTSAVEKWIERRKNEPDR